MLKSDLLCISPSVTDEEADQWAILGFVPLSAISMY